ncbi:hypothetical protein VB834_05590 [Limnoraphis robusta Tam1]|uniref:hypothetical protein n=1 Tax=Limnoraphis robusta TaxID=1118279 RepID=UPI002B217E49|nr:hypothetical protein [Limnoraphis robusta]MEA5496201.1 hypothetical protein [Limnoraphis robusta BA-68 BA1]MEA5538503.1 hypothetical protein [Limnoraphis robusta Tam1]
MKVKEIEFGLTTNLGNYESARMALRVELEDWEDYKQSLAKLKQEVVQLMGGDTSIMRKLATDEHTQELVKQIRDVQREYRSKKKELDSLLYDLSQTEDEINRATQLLEKFRLFKHDPNLSEIEKVIDSYERLKNNQLEPEQVDGMF